MLAVNGFATVLYLVSYLSLRLAASSRSKIEARRERERDWNEAKRTKISVFNETADYLELVQGQGCLKVSLRKMLHTRSDRDNVRHPDDKRKKEKTGRRSTRNGGGVFGS